MKTKNNIKELNEKFYNAKNDKGNSAVIALVFVAIIIVIIFFIGIIFVSQLTSILYNIKLDMYSINKAAITSVNKGITSRTNNINYYENDYKKSFEELLKKNYSLNDNFTSDSGIVRKATIKEYKILKLGAEDSYTNSKCKSTQIHTVVEVKIRPLFFEEMLEDKFTFDIHEDVAMELLKM